MRTLIKLNRATWPRILTAVLPSADDPRVLLEGSAAETAFSEAVSTFKFGTTFKTTQRARFPLTIDALSQLEYQTAPVILDVAASDGITSLDIMKALPFRKYFITDAHLAVSALCNGQKTYFYDGVGECVLIAGDRWITYRDTAGAVPPFGSFVRRMFERAPALSSDAKQIVLINPAVQAQMPPNVRVQQYDILQRWQLEKADLVIAANILNRGYFSDAVLMRALDNFKNAMDGNGRLAIIENRTRSASGHACSGEVERATIFRFVAGCASVERRINGGSEIEDLVFTLDSSLALD